VAGTRSSEPVRHLTAEQLGVDVASAGTSGDQSGSNLPDESPLDPSDSLLVEVRDLLQTYGGVILTGPPGTSKSWYARKIGLALADADIDRVRFMQFHPSYQYEDFVQGYVPDPAAGGFRLKDKHLLEMAEAAARAPTKLFVLVIDELSRGDPTRIFGEALTYVEKTKRGLHFNLSSGDACVIPDNLVFLTTMNPLDRGVDEVDAAFERRFAKIPMDPDVRILEQFLDQNGVTDPMRGRVIGFFRKANGMARTNPFGALGHTFFTDVHDEASLRGLWRHQLRFLFEKAYQLDADGLRELEQGWSQITAQSAAQAQQSAASPSPDQPSDATPQEAMTGPPDAPPGQPSVEEAGSGGQGPGTPA
jgi:5-methylcytosine-specific restriction protein B